MSGSNGSEEIARSVDRDRVENAPVPAADEALLALQRVRSGLANLADEPVPEGVVRRVDDALADEAGRRPCSGPSE